MRTLRRAREDGERGFTLIEALVALAVLSASLAAIGQLGFSTVKAARRAETRLLLASTARKAYAALPDRASLASSSLSGAMDGANWRLRSSPFPFETPGASGAPAWTPQAIRLVVAAPGGGEITIDTIRLVPAAAAR